MEDDRGGQEEWIYRIVNTWNTSGVLCATGEQGRLRGGDVQRRRRASFDLRQALAERWQERPARDDTRQR